MAGTSLTHCRREPAGERSHLEKICVALPDSWPQGGFASQYQNLCTLGSQGGSTPSRVRDAPLRRLWDCSLASEQGMRQKSPKESDLFSWGAGE